MPIRITGMNSGFDTENIISELVKAQQTKVDSVKKKQTSLQWKQDAWKELNSKVYKLFNGTIANMRFSEDYSKKITDVSDSSVANVVTSDSSMNITQELIVSELAKAGYMTGDTIKHDVTAFSKLTDMGIAEGSTVSVNVGGKTTDIKITADTTIQSFVGHLRNAGVEASYDEKNKRFNIASKASGVENDFTITAANSDGTKALKELGILCYDESAKKEYKKYAEMATDSQKKDAAIAAEVEKRRLAYINQRENLLKTQTTQETALASSKSALEGALDTGETIDGVLADSDYKTKLQAEIDALKDSENEDDKSKLEKLKAKMSAYEKYEEDSKALNTTKAALQDIKNYVDDSDKATGNLKADVTSDINDKITAALNTDFTAGNTDLHKVVAKDATIILNGATYTGTSNTFEINGLTITALKKSSDVVTLTTRQDTDGIYDMVKNFIKEYNAIINEMDKLYNAESAKGYEPLTDDEKKELSDSEVEKWETKIKDSILRRDSNLSTLSTALKSIMLRGASVNGTQMYLSSFGIETASYFSSTENEKNAYHINGDSDDSSVSAKENTLKAAIAANPDDVISFFSQLSQNLYTELYNQSKSLEGVRSFGYFYDDKKMKEDYNTYTTKIKQQEAKLTAMQDRWYKKFSAMETALARMQSNQSAVASLLGG